MKSICIVAVYTGWSKTLCAPDDLYCNRQVHRDFLITLDNLYVDAVVVLARYVNVNVNILIKKIKLFYFRSS